MFRPFHRSMRVMRTVVVMLAVGLCASVAQAGVKVEMLCGVYAGGKITTPLPSKAKPKLEGKAACAMHLTEAKADSGYLGQISTVRYTIDPATKQTVKATTPGGSRHIPH